MIEISSNLENKYPGLYIHKYDVDRLDPTLFVEFNSIVNVYNSNI